MQTDLKEIASWCYKQIELLNRLKQIKDFPDEIEFCARDYQFDEVHIYTGIEKIASALKLPLQVRLGNDFYRKEVMHMGITFFQMGHYS